MHPGAGYLVTKFCNQPCRPSLALVRISDSAPATGQGPRIADGAAVVYAVKSLRAHPFAGEARSEDAAFRSPSTPLPKNQANAPMRGAVRRYFLAIGRPRGGVPRLSVVNKKEKNRVKIESIGSLALWSQPEEGRYVY